MNDLISPRYQMKLVDSVHEAIKKEYPHPKNAELYIKKWHESDENNWNWENFHIVYTRNESVDILLTLHNMTGEILLKVAIDLGVDTPDFIPSVPTFKNTIKSDYKTAYDTFARAYKQIETDPSIALGLANSALESIIKEILKDERISSKIKGTETLYRLTTIILKEFGIADPKHPREIKTISSSLLSINQSIEKLRSEKTDFHGKTSDDILITDTVYTYFVINCISTVGLFLNSYYNTKFPKPKIEEVDDLPF